jgi:glycosyltransferase involved in cell wall biosynthesis
MKITIDVRMLHSSGIGTYIRNLVPRILDAYPSARFSLLGDPKTMGAWKGFQKPNVDLVKAEAGIYGLSEQMVIPAKIPRGTDLFWSPHYNFPVLWKGKLLVTVHDVFHVAMPRYVRGFHRRWYARAMFDQLARRADAVIAVSQFTRSELAIWTKVDRQKVGVVPNGIDPSWFDIPRIASPHPRPYLLFVGNIKPHKNLGRLLEAFGSLQDKIPHDLVLVGKKEGFIVGDKRIFEKARALKGRVHFTGEIDDQRLQQYYAFTDLLVFPSLYEGFGLPPLEAMACGRPVAASFIPSLVETCGKAVQFFDPNRPEDIAQKIQEVLGNEELRQDLVRKGLEQARQFSWEKCAEGTRQVIDNALGL